MMLRTSQQPLVLTRRHLLGSTLGLVGLGLLTACGGTPATGTTAPTAAKATAATTAPTSGATAASTTPAAAGTVPATGGASPTSASSASPAATRAASPGAASTAPQGGELIVGVTGADPDMLDPQITAWGNTAALANNIFDPLVWADPKDNSFKAGLADSWEASADGQTYTFKLKNGVKFHDGTPFNGEAVKFNFDRIANPATASKLAVTLLGPYEATEVVDDVTVRIKFKTPYGAFLDAASRANLGMASPTAVKKLGADFGRAPVGSGYFKFKEWIANQHIKLERNPDYAWASPVFSHQGPPNLDLLTYRSVPEEATALAAFEKGELHVFGLPYREVARFEQAGKYTIVKYTYRGFPSSYLINTEKTPTSDVQVRKALLHAINPEAVVKISFSNVPKAAHTPLNSTSLGYDAELAKLYPLDPQKAQKILDDAGWKAGSDGIRAKGGEKLKLIFTGAPGWEPYAEPVQAQLREVGVDMEIRILAPAARMEANIKGEHHLAGLGFSNSDPSVLTNIFHSKNIASGFGWSRFRNKDLDDLLDKAQQVAALDERRKLYGQIQRIIMDNALCVPLVEGGAILAFPQNVTGITLETRGFPYYYDAAIKK